MRFIKTKTTLFLTAMATARENNSKPPVPKKPIDEESRAQRYKTFYYFNLQVFVISQFVVLYAFSALCKVGQESTLQWST